MALSTGRQIKAARALLGWSPRKLADYSGLHRNAVQYWERAPVIPPPLPSGRRNTISPGCERLSIALQNQGIRLPMITAQGLNCASVRTDRAPEERCPTNPDIQRTEASGVLVEATHQCWARQKGLAGC